MLSDTLTAGLEHYQIGSKIRALRLQKGLGQAQLGKHTGLSPAMLSKIERGQVFPTLPTLLRIALVFGVGLEYFFVDTGKQPLAVVTRKKDRLRLPDRPGEDRPSYFFESLDYPATDRRMEAYYAEFPLSSNPSEPHQHPGVELVYVLKGQLIIELEGHVFVLAEGDAIHFDCRVRHSYGVHGKAACSAVVVVVP
jgi:transcriptional regulator with XRE-family HTH domain